MNGPDDEMITFGVRQLALMFGKSEQTVRRWKDEGKLRDGISGKEDGGGALVFTLEAVQEFVRHNPRVMNQARPEFIREFLGEDGMSVLRHGKKAERNTADERTQTAKAKSATVKSGRGKSRYIVQLMFQREEELKRRITELAEELDQICGEKECCRERSYLMQLLANREKEVVREMEEVRLELVRILEEKKIF